MSETSEWLSPPEDALSSYVNTICREHVTAISEHCQMGTHQVAQVMYMYL